MLHYLVSLLEDGCDVTNGEDEVGLHSTKQMSANNPPEGQRTETWRIGSRHSVSRATHLAEHSNSRKSP